MPTLIQFKRGLLSGLPAASVGEPLFSTDVPRLYIGNSGGNQLLGVKHNIAATTDPGVNDDQDDGYSRGSTWVNTTDDGYFVCKDATVGAAVWQELATAADTGITQLTGDVTAGPGSGSQAATIAAGAVSNSKFRDSSALSVVGRSANSTGSVADIAAGSDGWVLRRSGTALGFGTLASGAFLDNTIASSRLAFAATSRLAGRTTAGAGAGEELTGTQVTTLLDTFTNLLKGLVPASGGGTANFMRADGTWAVPPGTTDITSMTAGDVAGQPDYNDDYVPVYSTANGANRKVLASRLFGYSWQNQIRLQVTIASASSIDQADSNVADIHVVPFGGGRLTLWDGTRPVSYQIPTTGIGLRSSAMSSALTNGKNYDVFVKAVNATASSADTGTEVITLSAACEWESGAMVIPATTAGGLTAGTVYYWHRASSTTGTLHTTLINALANASPVNITASITTVFYGVTMLLGAAWTSDVGRATGITQVANNNHAGVYVYSSDSAMRLVGTVRPVGGAFVDNAEQRFVSSLYNASSRPLFKCPGYNNNAASTTYTCGTGYNELNGSGNGRIEWVSCVPEHYLITSNIVAIANAGGALRIGISYDTVADIHAMHQINAGTGDILAPALAARTATSGYHFAALVGRSNSGNATIVADRDNPSGGPDGYTTLIAGIVCP